MIRISFLIVVLGLWMPSTLGQAGYFGALNSIETHTFLVPNLQRTNEFVLDGSKTLLNRRVRILSPSYCINFSRILKSNVELNLGFTFSRQKSYLTELRPVQLNNSSKKLVLMKDLIIFQRGLTFETRKYIHRNKAPSGRYIAFSMAVNTSSFQKNQDFIYAEYLNESVKGNILNNWINVENITFENLNYNEKIWSVSAAIAWGRNLLIAPNLFFNYSYGITLSSFQVIKNSYNVDFYSFIYNPDDSKIIDNNFESTLFKTHYLYNLCRLQLGLKFFLKK